MSIFFTFHGPQNEVWPCGLMKFNLVEESFSFLSLPVGTEAMYFRTHRRLATLNGLLYMFFWETKQPDHIYPWEPNYREARWTSHIDIWMLQDVVQSGHYSS